MKRIFQHNTHFTLNTHLDEGQKGLDIKYTDFLKEICEKEKDMEYDTIAAKVKKICSEVFYGLGEQVPQLKEDKLGCGMYGLDFMVERSGEVKLLEITVAPDCERAQRDYPNYWNEILGLLIHGKQSPNLQRIC